MGPKNISNIGFGNTSLLEEIYATHEQNRDQVDPSWHSVFEDLESSVSFPPISRSLSAAPIAQEGFSDLRLKDLIHAYRSYGHLAASTNPLSEEIPKKPEQLNLENFGFSAADLEKKFPTIGLVEGKEASLDAIIKSLESIYCGKIGIEYIDLYRPELEKWLQQRIEGRESKKSFSLEQKKMILQYLNKSELFELFLHTKYTGQKRFSIEGGEALIPVLAAIVDKGSELGAEEFVIGMAHRGRLNVLSNILNKSYAQIFSEFDENFIPESFEESGDVKYHKGFFSEDISCHGHKVQITLVPNPSHLEAVDPIVEGQVYAKQKLLGGNRPQEKVVPLLVHGDAALAGQGVVYETMQFCDLKGYGTGGTIHVVVNNQIGFTTTPEDSRSTRYCTDIARIFMAPVFHVNAEDLESCIFVTNLAVEMRQKFHCDVFIDLICYRKYGHNETDEPSYTQPLAYQIISKKKSVREIYRDHLIEQGVLEKKIAEELEAAFKQSLQEELKAIPKIERAIPDPPPQDLIDETIFRHIQTGVPLAVLQEIAASACSVPEGFSLHPKLVRLLKDRLAMTSETNPKPIDWGMAEVLAFGSLLHDNFDVRLSGQDSCRGTFSHRHALLIDQKTNDPYYPLKHLKFEKGKFDVYNSPLSEYGVLAFDYGYSIANPKALVIWEAQFGDFFNGAQIVVDQFLSTGEQKWGQQSGLVLFLPHGYEGQGPEHSSGRMERFLTLCGQNNLRVANPSTPVQLFHLLRRQMFCPEKKPLIVFTPKALLRHPACVSKIEEFTLGSFQEILDDPKAPQKVDKIVLCSGHVYYDLIAERDKLNVEGMAIIRIEQLYPFYSKRLFELLEKYKGFKKLLWVQEEPSNMGAKEFVSMTLREQLPKEVDFSCISRPRSASTAVGSHAWHKKQLADILAAVFDRRKPSIFEIASKK